MKPWFNVTLSGHDYKVLIFEDGEETPEGTEVAGVINHDTGTIYVRREVKVDHLHDNLLHELLHGILYTSGLWSFMKSRLKRGVNFSQFEEDVVQQLTPALLGALKGSGLFKRRKVAE